MNVAVESKGLGYIRVQHFAHENAVKCEQALNVFSLFAYEKHVVGVFVMGLGKLLDFLQQKEGVKGFLVLDNVDIWTISTFREIYQLSGNYINAQRIISTFKTLYQRSAFWRIKIAAFISGRQ